MVNLAEIQKKIKELQEQEAELINKEKNAVISRILEDIANYGITAEDLGFSGSKATKKQKIKAEVKYRKGDLTWTGRGRKPAWVTEEYKV